MRDFPFATLEFKCCFVGRAMLIVYCDLQLTPITTIYTRWVSPNRLQLSELSLLFTTLDAP